MIEIPESRKSGLARLALVELLELAITVARLPVIGLYGMVVLMFLSMSRQAPADTWLASMWSFLDTPFMHGAWEFLGLSGKFEGLSGAAELGWRLGIIAFALHILALPFRILLRKRFPPSLHRDAIVLLWFTVGLGILLAAALGHVELASGTPYWGAVATMAVILCVLYALGFLFAALPHVVRGLAPAVDPLRSDGAMRVDRKADRSDG